MLTSLHLFLVCRYALQLISPASILARLAGRTEIGVEDISEMNDLFLDAKRSALSLFPLMARYRALH